MIYLVVNKKELENIQNLNGKNIYKATSNSDIYGFNTSFDKLKKSFIEDDSYKGIEVVILGCVIHNQDDILMNALYSITGCSTNSLELHVLESMEIKF
jgi:hypothetical protein